jgi:hypothetical protein
MQKMPEQVKIGPHVYAIVRTGYKDRIGNCDFQELKIFVRARLRRSKAQEILLHEVLHGCTHPTLNGNKRYTDEDFVEAIAPTLQQVLRENPELVRYLCE